MSDNYEMNDWEEKTKRDPVREIIKNFYGREERICDLFRKKVNELGETGIPKVSASIVEPGCLLDIRWESEGMALEGLSVVHLIDYLKPKIHFPLSPSKLPTRYKLELLMLTDQEILEEFQQDRENANQARRRFDRIPTGVTTVLLFSDSGDGEKYTRVEPASKMRPYFSKRKDVYQPVRTETPFYYFASTISAADLEPIGMVLTAMENKISSAKKKEST